MSQPTPLAAEHVHRYRFAAGLCRGARVLDVGCGSGYGSRILRSEAASVTGMDNDAPTIAHARETIGASEEIEFEVVDAVEALGRDLVSSFDVVVAFRLLELLPDPEKALDLLAGHAAAGVRVILSVPNSHAFDEPNELPPRGFGFEEAIAAFGRFEDVTVLYQYVAEGSVIQGEEAGSVHPELVLREQAEREYANHFVACVNFGSSAALEEASARIHVGVAPAHNRSMLSLAVANRELHRINVRLAKGLLGAADSAAATLAQKIRDSDEFAHEVSRALDRPRYRLVDGLRARMARIPAVDALIRLAGRRLSR